MINNEDFKTWLNDPCTKFFQEWVKKNRDDFKQQGVDIAYFNSFHNERNPKATAYFEICKGLDSVLNMFEDVKNQIKEELEELQKEEKDREKVSDVIGEMIEYIYPKAKTKDDQNN